MPGDSLGAAGRGELWGWRPLTATRQATAVPWGAAREQGRGDVCPAFCAMSQTGA